MTARLRTTTPKFAVAGLVSLLIGCSGGGRSLGEGLGDAGDGGDFGDGGLGGDASLTPLTIDPPAPVLQVTGAEATIQLTAMLDGMPLKAAAWSSDNLRLGYIDGQGVFHSKGLVAGTTTITARF